MELLFRQFSLSIEWFARAGGGGSAGSGGGGGEGIFFLFGYLPMHFIGAFLRKRFLKNEKLFIVLNVVGWVTALAYIYVCVVIWQGAGLLIGLAGLPGMGAGLYGWFGKLKRSSIVQSTLKKAAANDKAWNEENLMAYACQVFMRYQYDWSVFDINSIKTYTTPLYARHSYLLLMVLHSMRRHNNMENVQIKEALIVEAYDHRDDTDDSFTVGFTAEAVDSLIDDATGEKLFVDTKMFTEYWTFRRMGDTWLLDDIQQATKDNENFNKQLAAFALQNGYNYSQDMGWLFIPKQGMIFSGAKFGVSDINNHVVGLYKEKLLVQLYTYLGMSVGDAPLVIAQVNVPKQYGRIIVRRNKFIQRPIFGDLKRVQTEWTQFNKKYEVFATSEEQAASFELLNPTYMEQLEALPFAVDIEVVDNVIYLSTKESSTNEQTYQTMLDLVQKAFQEMRL